MQFNDSLHRKNHTLIPLAAYANTAAAEAAVALAKNKGDSGLGDAADCTVMVVVLTGASDITSLTMEHGSESDGSDQAAVAVNQTHGNTPSPKATPAFLAAQLTDGQMALGALHCQHLDPYIGVAPVLAGAATFGVFLSFYNRKATEYSRDTFAFEYFA